MLSHKNNFDFLRLLAAFMVLFSHQHNLLGIPEAHFDPRITPGPIGVAIFFSISGYLVIQSWERDPHVFRFAFKRFLRIWPGLFVVTLLAACVIGPIVSALPAEKYFTDPGFIHYLNNLRLRITVELPGVFAANPYPRVVNGSTWSIPFEVRWYFILSIAGLLTCLKHRRIILIAVILLAIYQFGIYHAETNADRNWGREYGLYFCIGTLMWLYRDLWQARKLLVAVISVAASTLAYVFGQHLLAELIVIAPLTLLLGSSSTPILRQFGRFGDLSYGVYIYAFMVQQTLIWAIGPTASFSLHLALTVTITLACAFVSWHCIEKPALALKKASGWPLSGRMPRRLLRAD
ncbi:acyltransferase family protein [Burkholderia ubonensis]|uniref:acyltransferase family protein n=1 Tax=Burkholderia ubonensis TaxID=101571 RepID=UPI00075C359F|nr:acyltransferase [Burkholderia ubonensis]KVO24870.1 hypothetical protein WJ73_27910 [Burkholderia ubonensis]KVO25382.1 hypothetical protein WJ74_30200 [Burkholderia ubonensis]KVU44379.1 hypothetical protein WK66_17460 [Burkholderia ubonensis]KVU45854.1 hypothetical protein WK69_15035 [Burkholderia ubonensis]